MWDTFLGVFRRFLGVDIAVFVHRDEAGGHDYRTSLQCTR